MEDFDTLEGRGLSGKVEEQEMLIGSVRLMRESGVNTEGQAEVISQLESRGKSIVLLSGGGVLKGILAISDAPKPEAKHAIASFRKAGVRTVMVTGDNARSAKTVAKELGIDRVMANLLPGEKAAAVKRLQKKGAKVAFIGDGINDAPALAQADVGIAIGSGTDVAIESGDIVLIKDDLRHAVAAIQLSKKVMSRIRQNLFWAFAYNAALIPVAAGALFPLFGITFRPELAGLAMAMSSVTVVSLSLMLKGYYPPILGGKSRS